VGKHLLNLIWGNLLIDQFFFLEMGDDKIRGKLTAGTIFLLTMQKAPVNYQRWNITSK
jgi:hypothetical protein